MILNSHKKDPAMAAYPELNNQQPSKNQKNYCINIQVNLA